MVVGLSHLECVVFVCVSPQAPFLHYYGLFFLLYEASGPFFNIRKLMIFFGFTNTILFDLVSVRPSFFRLSIVFRFQVLSVLTLLLVCWFGVRLDLIVAVCVRTGVLRYPAGHWHSCFNLLVG